MPTQNLRHFESGSAKVRLSLKTIASVQKQVSLLLCFLTTLAAVAISSNVNADVFKPIKDSKILKPLKNANIYGHKFEAVAVGTTTPDFTLKSLSGQNIRLEEHRGKVVIITFWASWCGPCRIELPHFQRLQQDIGKDKMTILAVSADSKLEDVSSFSTEFKLDIPMLFDPGLKVNQLYRIRAMPTTFIIDRGGVIRHIHMGFKESTLSLYETELHALINE